MAALDPLSALTQIQLPANAATNPAGPIGSTPLGPTAPLGESFSNLLTPATDATASAAAPLVPASGGASPTTWGHMVHQMVMDVNAKQQDAASMVTDVLKGGPTPVHQAVIASEEASLSFTFLAEMRNKVIDAYNQVMQMQV
ncbi:MAG: flagellar hook-basal body complex protein FliE [Verrucomicrobiota bacterium]